MDRPPAGRSFTVTLTRILPDEHENPPHCRGSVEGHFDEVIVIDAGSTDDLNEVAQSLVVRLSKLPLADAFSSARDVTLAHTTVDDIFWMDARDILEPGQGERLRRLTSGFSPGSSTVN